MRRVCITVLLAGLFVLMLSALVVTPSDAQPPAAPRMPADFCAALVPRPAPEAPCAAGVPVRTADWRLMAYAVTPAPLSAVLPAAARDANGRVLFAARYAKSVHQVFRPDVAGG